ncbi:hypothetical protein J7K28_00860 [Candidatus Aerophobetes bacterium]|nr:hypothetical protein [Candidatus Aerophobetes bacterium]
MHNKRRVREKMAIIKSRWLGCIIILVIFISAVGIAFAQVNKEISFEGKLAQVKIFIAELKSFPKQATLIEEILAIYSKKIKNLNTELQQWRQKATFFENLANLYKTGEGGIDELRKEISMLSRDVDSLIAENKKLKQKIDSLEKENYKLRKELRKYKQQK